MVKRRNELIKHLLKPVNISGIIYPQYTPWGLQYKRKILDFIQSVIIHNIPETTVIETPIISKVTEHLGKEIYYLNEYAKLRHDIHDSYATVVDYCSRLEQGKQLLCLLEKGLVFRNEETTFKKRYERMNVFTVIAMHILCTSYFLDTMLIRALTSIEVLAESFRLDIIPKVYLSDSSHTKYLDILRKYHTNPDILVHPLDSTTILRVDFCCHAGLEDKEIEIFSLEVEKNARAPRSEFSVPFVIDVTFGSVERLLHCFCHNKTGLPLPLCIYPFHVAVSANHTKQWSTIKEQFPIMRSIVVSKNHQESELPNEVLVGLVPYYYSAKDSMLRSSDGKAHSIIAVANEIAKVFQAPENLEFRDFGNLFIL
jgi:hypothetical protein